MNNEEKIAMACQMACESSSLACKSSVEAFNNLKKVTSTKDEPDMINHPSHYISETGLETIDVVEAFTFDLKGIEATDTGNIIKYISRWKKKNGLQDLEKAQWYLNHLINHVKKLDEENKNLKEENEHE